MNLKGFISADSHVNEPEAAYERIPKKLREKGPRFVQDPPGKKGLYIVFEGHSPDPVGNTFLAGTAREPGVVKDRSRILPGTAGVDRGTRALGLATWNWMA